MDYYKIILDKIVSVDECRKYILDARLKGEKAVFTNGCFDILHRGHITYLAKAAELGDLLIVGLNNDASVKRLKGDDRPLHDETARAQVLASLLCVDRVVLFGEDTPQKLISELLPGVLVKGADYAIENIVGADVVLAHGGEVKTIDLVDGYSTTNVINKLSV